MHTANTVHSLIYSDPFMSLHYLSSSAQYSVFILYENKTSSFFSLKGESQVLSVTKSLSAGGQSWSLRLKVEMQVRQARVLAASAGLQDTLTWPHSWGTHILAQDAGSPGLLSGEWPWPSPLRVWAFVSLGCGCCSYLLTDTTGQGMTREAPGFSIYIPTTFV